jgi:hypothetical protein
MAWLFAAANAVTATIVLFGVFGGLPARFWPVDAAAVVVAALESGAAVGSVVRARWGVPLARVAATSVLAFGLAVVTTLALTASWLSGVYGPVGLGGAVIFFLVAALALPYLVGCPAAQLVWLGRAGSPSPLSSTEET